MITKVHCKSLLRPASLIPTKSSSTRAFSQILREPKPTVLSEQKNETDSCKPRLRDLSLSILEEQPPIQATKTNRKHSDTAEEGLDPFCPQPFGLETVALPHLDTDSGSIQRIELARGQVLAQLLPSLVKKAAWHIDPNRGSATLRLEIGSGLFDGATVVIRADLHEVHIELDAPPTIDLEAWKRRLRLRLASQGLTAMVS